MVQDSDSIPVFSPEGYEIGQVEVVYDQSPSIIRGAKSICAIRCRDLFEYLKRIKTAPTAVALINEAERSAQDVCVLFWRGERSGLQMCTRTEIRIGVVNGLSTPMVSLFARLDLYNVDYPTRPFDAVRAFIGRITDSL